MAALPSAAIDHIIVLLPYKDIITTPQWLSDHFTITPGGRHADGKTENRLIILPDGSYIELIAFIDDDPERRAGHWWDKPCGIVDYALTSSDRFDPEIRARLERAVDGMTYAKPQAGGRTRPDGVRVEWEVTFPEGVDRGFIPFWCHDTTPRDRRVPRETKVHPSEVLGIAAVTVKVPEAQIERIDKALAAIVNDKTSTRQHKIQAPEEVSGTREPYLGLSISDEHRIELSLQIPAGSSRQPIVQRVGNGEVKISFTAVRSGA